MMCFKQNIHSLKTLVLACALVLGFATSSYAQDCETDMELAGWATATKSAQAAGLFAAEKAIELAVTTETALATAALVAGVMAMDLAFRETILSRLWRWPPAPAPKVPYVTDGLGIALEGLAEQISVSQIDQMKMMGGAMDAQINGQQQRILQEQELEIRDQMTPNEQSCVVDSAGPSMAKARATGKAIAKGMEGDSDILMTNRAGGAGASGVAGVHRKLFDDYCNFASAEFNRGATGCPVNQANPLYTDLDVRVSDLLFGKYTLDMSDALTRRATIAMQNNLLGMVRNDVVEASTLAGPTGQQALLDKRSYLARMSVPRAIVARLVGERAQGDPAPAVAALRTDAGVSGTDISARPSEREIRQALVDQLWSPKYYASLASGNPIEREVELRAMKLMLYYTLIERAEKVSVLLANQLAARVEASPLGKYNAQDAQRMKN